MGLKKNYFKHLEYGVHSPVKQKIDVRDPEFIPEEVQKLLNKDPRELTIEEVQKLPPPENETDYKARTYLRPEDPLDPEAGPEEKLMNFVYDKKYNFLFINNIKNKLYKNFNPIELIKIKDDEN